MDRNQAAINPAAADKHVAEQVANKLLHVEPDPLEVIDPNRPRTAFLGMAGQLKEEVTADHAKNESRAKKIWDSV